MHLLLVSCYSCELTKIIFTCLYFLQKLTNYCQDGELFADEKYQTNSVAERLMMEVERISQVPFYGRCMAFQVSI